MTFSDAQKQQVIKNTLQGSIYVSDVGVHMHTHIHVLV
jgi:hypothetical protein